MKKTLIISIITIISLISCSKKKAVPSILCGEWKVTKEIGKTWDIYVYTPTAAEYQKSEYSYDGNTITTYNSGQYFNQTPYGDTTLDYYTEFYSFKNDGTLEYHYYNNVNSIKKEINGVWQFLSEDNDSVKLIFNYGVSTDISGITSSIFSGESLTYSLNDINTKEIILKVSEDDTKMDKWGVGTKKGFFRIKTLTKI